MRRARGVIGAALPLFLTVALLAGFLAGPAVAAPFTVTSGADTDDGACDSDCTLREAIDAANRNVGEEDTIGFALLAAPATIAVESSLPAITDPLVIDGTTQPGYAGRPVVELRGPGGFPGVEGLTVIARDSTIRGLAINGFFIGVDLRGQGGNRIEGNFIGTDLSGGVARGNTREGIRIGSGSNRIGGTGPNEGNLISGNTGGAVSAGIRVEGPADGQVIEGNLIGTDVTGGDALPNAVGVVIATSDNTIGGSQQAARNVISGNVGGGVRLIEGATGNRIEGNYVGTDRTGSGSVGNGGAGVAIGVGSHENVVGGSAVNAGNVISANGVGLDINLANRTRVQGNLIGTDASGSAALGNAGPGVSVVTADDTLIGGREAGARNVISANGTSALVGGGIVIGNGPNNRTRVEGNLIGTDITGAQPLGNAGIGVACCGVFGGTDNRIGGVPVGAGNVIAFNSGDGVVVGGVFEQQAPTRGTSMLGNSIFSNAGLGIDLQTLTDQQPTPNDAGDPDTGPNELQNFPVVTDVRIVPGATTVDARLNSLPDRTYRVEFFRNRECDPEGFGEGGTFLGARDVTTDASGNVSFSATFPVALSAAEVVTTTATDPDGNTSEFSECHVGRPVPIGTIVVEKRTVPGSDPAKFAFSGDAAGSIGDGERITVAGLEPGTYRSTEAVPAGWDLTSIACSDQNSSGDPATGSATFNLEVGETVVCTFTNTKRGTVVVEKQTVPDGTAGSFTFTGASPGTIGDGGRLTADGLLPGTYSAQEADPGPGFELESIACDDENSGGDQASRTATIRLEPGETVKCVFTNRKRPEPPPNRPPDCTGTAQPSLLWPPNHKFHLISLGGISDPDGDPVVAAISGVTQDEPLNGLGDGDTAPDARRGPTASQVYVRSERSGLLDGRVYRINYRATDSKGAVCTGTAAVGVPHDMGQGSAPIDSAPPSYNSFGP
jgi:CSLREA domain-containing protein